MLRVRLSTLALAPLLVLVGCSPDDRPRGPDAPADGASVDAEDTPPPPPVDGGCAPCVVDGPGTYCGLQVTIAPFEPNTNFEPGFQSTPGTGASEQITITLSAPINWVSVTVKDPDFDGNKLQAYDAANALVSEVTFPADGTPSVLTNEAANTGGAGIVRVELIPAPADYVVYDDLRVIPEGCAPPIL